MSQLRTGPRHCYLARPKPQAGEAEAYCGKALTPCRHVAAHICAVSLLMPCLRLGSALLSWRAVEAEMEREREILRGHWAAGTDPQSGAEELGDGDGLQASNQSLRLSVSLVWVCVSGHGPRFMSGRPWVHYCR